MRIVVLGGSAASPNSGAGCSGYLVQAGATSIYVDPGPGTLQELRRWTDFRALDAVLVSHMHLDHMLDLLALRHALAYNPIAPTRPVPVWLPPGGAAFLEQATAPFDACDDPGVFSERVQVREYDPAEVLSIRGIAVTFAPTVHWLPCWAMRFSAGGVSVGYTADTGPGAALTPFCAGVDLLIAEATLLVPPPEGVEQRSLTAADAGSLAAACGAKQLVLTHYWEEHPVEAMLTGARAHFTGPVEIARPGLTIEVGRGHAG